ncbi:hypothetical protein HHL16_12685 [Pseudoflavitalea sp. G-6-1-2]|uniref:hypothetical protein n=1 Tax=Pseudoflavitalea sp. G-6-1-2 TaxID=2728841 RepID=UPI00146C1053|nr:hypothetical protein [Pseudoflavitalea sp. G-6-1-2]NML21739.1 hypothetical protein [Pseudoflavitalea sp. G-6-1-2]
MVSGLPNVLNTTYPAASASASLSLSATNLAAPVEIKAPPAFELSYDNSNFSSQLMVGAPGNLSSTPIYYRLKAGTAADTYSYNIELTSTGAAAKYFTTAICKVNPKPIAFHNSDPGNEVAGACGRRNIHHYACAE